MNKDFKNINISDDLLKAITSLEYDSLTEIQSKVIPLGLEGHNILGSSSTGSGKTAAFLLPVLERTDWEENDANVLILAPSRELAVQIKREYDILGRYKKLTCVAVFGKQPFKEQEQRLKAKHQAIAGTPGRVLDHIKRGTIDTSTIRYLIIDEADELLNRGFRDEVLAIVKKLRNVKQSMLFSATLNPQVKKLATEILGDYRLVEAEDKEELNIEEILYTVKQQDKFKALLSVIFERKPKSMIIFVNSRDECDIVKERLEEQNVYALKIHGGMLQEDRLKAMDRFKNKEIAYLVATDVAARGIDVTDVDISLSYDFPVEKESFVHRKGRTGRNYKEGLAIYFISEYDEKYVREAANFIGTDLDDRRNIDLSFGKTEKDAFLAFQKELRQNRPEKKVIHKDIVKLYINGGRKKKIRPLDIAGTLNSIPGIEAEDIGIIDVQDNVTYVDILNGKGDIALQGLNERKIKGKELKVEKAKK
jgi:superfamily II DNA/RNA helicase